MRVSGKIYKFGNDINTDIIIPARFCNTTEINELASKCMYDIYNNFFAHVNLGDVIVAGNNFGCGSSREVAAIAIKGCGISCVIAKSFANIFYRNAINVGLRLIETKDIYDFVEENDNIVIVINDNKTQITVNGMSFQVKNYEDEIVQSIVNDGGLINYIKNRY